MTREFFVEQMKLIVADFGADEYTPHRMSLIWDHCKDLTDRSFAWIVRHFCETKSVKYPPLPTHFAEAALEQHKILRQTFGEKKVVRAADEPERTGVVLYEFLERTGARTVWEGIQKSKGEKSST